MIYSRHLWSSAPVTDRLSVCVCVCVCRVRNVRLRMDAPAVSICVHARARSLVDSLSVAYDYTVRQKRQTVYVMGLNSV